MKEFAKNLKFSLLHDEDFNKLLINKGVDTGQVSDGYHTFEELYHYRAAYNAGMFNLLKYENIPVVKSKCHYTGEKCFNGNYFIAQAKLPTGQISNHYPIHCWNLFKIPEAPTAWEWDGHDSAEAIKRLEAYILDYMPNYSEVSSEKVSDDDWCFIVTDDNRVVLCSQIISFSVIQENFDPIVDSMDQLATDINQEKCQIVTTGNNTYEVSMSINQLKEKLTKFFLKNNC